MLRSTSSARCLTCKNPLSKSYEIFSSLPGKANKIKTKIQGMYVSTGTFYTERIGYGTLTSDHTCERCQ